MPVYEYYCKTCDDRFEVLQPVAKMAAEATCPEGHLGAHKVLSLFASVARPEGCASPASLPDTPCRPTGCACHN